MASAEPVVENKKCRCRCYCNPVCRCQCQHPNNSGLLYPGTKIGKDGTVSVTLAANHPGKDDEAYVQRRTEIANISHLWRPGQEPPTVEYSQEENQTWKESQDKLHDLHERYACQQFIQGKKWLGLPQDRVPQLAEVNQRLAEGAGDSDSACGDTGFRFLAAPGLVALRKFYGALGLRQFFSTQYLRHGGDPLYTPEPDVIHEVVGHGNALAHKGYADLTAAAGEATTRLHHFASVKFVADVFWFTFEFGLLQEASDFKAYGAGVLSSYGEMKNLFEQGDLHELVEEHGDLKQHLQDRQRAADELNRQSQAKQAEDAPGKAACDVKALPVLRPLNIVEMGTVEYDITDYQRVYFFAQSWDQIDSVVGEFFRTVTDDMVAHMLYERG